MRSALLKFTAWACGLKRVTIPFEDGTSETALVTEGSDIAAVISAYAEINEYEQSITE